MYTALQIASAVNAPLDNVRATWPATLNALARHGINTHAVRIAMAATIAVETTVTENGVNMTFLPVVELGGQYAWYAPYYGRGTIQCTLESNYRSYGPRLSPPQDLIKNPDALLDQTFSAQFAGLYFMDHNIAAMAEAGNWVGVRVAVNGGNGIDKENGGTTNGLNSFLSYVRNLESLTESPDGPPKYRVTVKDCALKSQPTHTSPAAIDPAHLDVHLKLDEFVYGTGKVSGEWMEVRPTSPTSVVHGWMLRIDAVDA